MTSVGVLFVVRLPLTSDEIKNVVRLSPRRDGESTNPPAKFLPRFAEIHRTGAGDGKRARNALIPSRSPGRASTMTNIFFTVALLHHRGFPVARENDFAARKNSQEGRSIRALDGAT